MSAYCQEIKTARRYFLLQQRSVVAQDLAALEPVFQTKQLGEPGTDLPGDFPFLSELNANRYFAVEDLDGASFDELAFVGITTAQATKIFAALAPLL